MAKINLFNKKGGKKVFHLNKPKNFCPDLEAVGCLVILWGEILILKRTPDHALYPNLWGFPSGKMEPGETPIEAMSRELREETGIATDSLLFLGTVYEAYPKIRFIYHLYRLNLKAEPVIRLNPKEHVAYRFDTFEGIADSSDVMPDSDTCIKHFCR